MRGRAWLDSPPSTKKKSALLRGPKSPPLLSAATCRPSPMAESWRIGFSLVSVWCLHAAVRTIASPELLAVAEAVSRLSWLSSVRHGLSYLTLKKTSAHPTASWCTKEANLENSIYYSALECLRPWTLAPFMALASFFFSSLAGTGNGTPPSRLTGLMSECPCWRVRTNNERSSAQHPLVPSLNFSHPLLFLSLGRRRGTGEVPRARRSGSLAMTWRGSWGAWPLALVSSVSDWSI